MMTSFWLDEDFLFTGYWILLSMMFREEARMH
jgi:hypothetical protein